MKSTNLSIHEKINVKSFLHNMGFYTMINKPAFVCAKGEVVYTYKIQDTYVTFAYGVWAGGQKLNDLSFENKPYKTN